MVAKKTMSCINFVEGVGGLIREEEVVLSFKVEQEEEAEEGDLWHPFAEEEEVAVVAVAKLSFLYLNLEEEVVEAEVAVNYPAEVEEAEP